MLQRVGAFWSRLSTGGRVGITTAAGLVIIGIIAAVTTQAGHSDSWKYGYDHAGTAISLVRQGVSAESGCRSVVGIAAGYATEAQSKTDDYGDMYDGCMAAVKDNSG